MAVEVRDVAPGLWLWRQPHPAWSEVLLDPLAPPPEAQAVWARLERRRPDAVVILKPDHVRDVDLFVRWYGARAYGPSLSGATTCPEPSSSASRGLTGAEPDRAAVVP